MADAKITQLADLGGAPAENDLYVLVDVSDTSMAPSGTDKNLTTLDLRGGILRSVLESADFTLDPTVHTDGCVIVATPSAASGLPGRIVTLPATADSPAVGYSISIYLSNGANKNITLNRHDGGLLAQISLPFLSLTYVGDNYWTARYTENSGVSNVNVYQNMD